VALATDSDFLGFRQQKALSSAHSPYYSEYCHLKTPL
jgi:hypothetical protein